MPILPTRSAALAVSCLLLTAGSGCVGATQPRDTPPDAATGSIAGVVRHPAHVVPAMRICALSTDPEKTRCIGHPTHADEYRIDGLAPGEYVVIAQVIAARATYRHGSHVQPVQCIRAPCPDMPATVTVTSGAHLDDIDLNAFHDRREDFPALPATAD
jgi:hypothetical protein